MQYGYIVLTKKTTTKNTVSRERLLLLQMHRYCASVCAKAMRLLYLSSYRNSMFLGYEPSIVELVVLPGTATTVFGLLVLVGCIYSIKLS